MRCCRRMWCTRWSRVPVGWCHSWPATCAPAGATSREFGRQSSLPIQTTKLLCPSGTIDASCWPATCAPAAATLREPHEQHDVAQEERG